MQVSALHPKAEREEMTTRFRLGFVAVAIVVLALASSAMAQAPAAGQALPAAPGSGSGGESTNLQVFPKATPLAEVIQQMVEFSQALGVQCSYCHTIGESTPAGNPLNDMAADTKPTKLVARSMMRMTAELNQTLAAMVKKPADKRKNLDCITCHRGHPIPAVPLSATSQEQCSDVLDEAANTCKSGSGPLR